VLLFFGFSAQLRCQLGHHLLEFLALAGLEDLNDSGMSRGTKIVELILEALVVVAKILQHHGDLIGLFRGEIELGLKVLKDSFPIGIAGRRGGSSYPVQPVMQSILHAEHARSGAGQEH
jgi:hypothetical protein